MSMKEMIRELNHPSIFAWFSEYNSLNLTDPDNDLEDGKLDFKYNYRFKDKLSYIKYPYGDVDYFNISKTNVMFLINSAIKITQCGFHCCDSPKLLSFKGFPKKVDGDVCVCVFYTEQYLIKYYNNNSDKYKIYLAMWLELFDSVTEEERWEYINEFKDRKDEGYSVIPKELLLEFGVI